MLRIFVKESNNPLFIQYNSELSYKNFKPNESWLSSKKNF